jgi:hypothetical protein
LLIEIAMRIRANWHLRHLEIWVQDRHRKKLLFVRWSQFGLLPGVPFGWMAEKLCDTAGPTFYAFDAIKGSGFHDIERHKTFTPRTPECQNTDAARSCATRPQDERMRGHSIFKREPPSFAGSLEVT